MCRFQQNRAVGGTVDSLLEEPRRRRSVRAPGLPKVSFPCFPDQSLRNAWTAGSQGPFTLWPVREERVALASPLPLVRLFYFSSVSHLVAAPPTQKRLSGMVAPPPPDPLPHPASSDSGLQVRL